jgi:UDP:flavonoid glycosyltransferase YjiC (YdhE family)
LLHSLGWSGHVHPLLAVAQGLLAREHAVAMLTATAYRSTVEAAGVTYLPPARSPDRDYNRLDATFRELRGLPNAEVLARLFGDIAVQDAPAQGHDLVTSSAAWRPDVLVNDGIALGVPLAAGLLRLPWATVSPFLICTIPDPDLPPPFLGVPWSACRRDQAMAVLLKRAVDLRLTRASRRWRTIAAAWKVAAPASKVHTAGSSPLLYLYPGGPPLEYPRRRWPARAHGVGPLFIGSIPGPIGPRSDRPRIFLTEGTTHTDRWLSRLAMRALAELPVDLMVALGDQTPNENIGPLPANTTTYRYVNYRAALNGAALLITNGGAGSLAAALEAGVPALILPAGLDKAAAAQRLASAGAGLRLPPAERCSPARFREAALALIEQPRYQRSAKAVGEQLLALGGAARAASLLVNLTMPQP